MLRAKVEMNIDLRKSPSDSGAYGLVVFIENKTKAVKIFKRSHSVDQADNVFKSEVEAYEKATLNNDASKIVPTFFGNVAIGTIIDRNGKDVTDQYYTDLAYLMSYEEGPFHKFSTIPESERQRIKETLQPVGVHYLIDCSVSLTNEKEVKCVIDFATEEFQILE